MLNPELFLAFLLITLVLVVTPGPIVTLVIATGATQGPRAALVSGGHRHRKVRKTRPGHEAGDGDSRIPARLHPRVPGRMQEQIFVSPCWMEVGGRLPSTPPGALTRDPGKQPVKRWGKTLSEQNWRCGHSEA
jgi:hypothetical protein